jgi:signal transduction histidine kinase
MDGSELPFRPAPFDLNQLLTEVIDETRQTTQHQIIAEFAAPVTLVGDRDRIAQVVTNLLTNAIKYSPHADRVVVRTALHDEHVTIAVQDFGIGIPKEDQPYIFDRFYRVTTHGRDGYAGLGLGLYIAAEFVKRHNGTIWVESNAGQGTTIAFSLPLTEPQAPQGAGIEQPR